MKNISLWALTNPWKAQIIISVIQIILAFLAIYSGVWLFAHDIIIPNVFTKIGLGLGFVALFLYPIRRSKYKIWKMSFVKQKSMDALMLFAYMLVVISISNSDARSAWNESVDDQFSQTIVYKKDNVNPQANKKLNRQEKRSIRKKVRKQFKQFVKKMKQKAKGDKKTGNKIFGVVLLIAALMVLVAFLACSVACSGANAAGLIILIGGWILAIVLGVHLIKKVKGGKKGSKTGL